MGSSGGSGGDGRAASAASSGFPRSRQSESLTHAGSAPQKRQHRPRASPLTWPSRAGRRKPHCPPNAPLLLICRVWRAAAGRRAALPATATAERQAPSATLPVLHASCCIVVLTKNGRLPLGRWSMHVVAARRRRQWQRQQAAGAGEHHHSKAPVSVVLAVPVCNGGSAVQLCIVCAVHLAKRAVKPAVQDHPFPPAPGHNLRSATVPVVVARLQPYRWQGASIIALMRARHDQWAGDE